MSRRHAHAAAFVCADACAPAYANAHAVATACARAFVDAFATANAHAAAHRRRADYGTARNRAVEIVDARHGYTYEFSSSPEAHLVEYDEETERQLALSANDGSCS